MQQLGDVDVERGATVARSRSQKRDIAQARPNAIQQLAILTRRGLRNQSRNVAQTSGFFLQAVLIGIGLGLAFFQLPETPGKRRDSAVQSRRSLTLFIFTPRLVDPRSILAFDSWHPVPRHRLLLQLAGILLPLDRRLRLLALRRAHHHRPGTRGQPLPDPSRRTGSPHLVPPIRHSRTHHLRLDRVRLGRLTP